MLRRYRYDVTKLRASDWELVVAELTQAGWDVTPPAAYREGVLGHWTVVKKK
jgi:hypothetical protein